MGPIRICLFSLSGAVRCPGAMSPSSSLSAIYRTGWHGKAPCQRRLVHSTALLTDGHLQKQECWNLKEGDECRPGFARLGTCRERTKDSQSLVHQRFLP